MLLLYPMREGCVFKRLDHLHSTMLLLYPSVMWSIRIRCIIYIPLCFYFILRSCCAAVRRSIYIPLCFYFIRSPALFYGSVFHLHSTMLLLYLLCISAVVWSSLDLHSTMLLLYRLSASTVRTSLSNLHSTMLLLYPDHPPCAPRFDLIYIPLCFYFIRTVYLRTAQCNTFTFHYASTLSCTPLSVCITNVKFTFHYASTLSDGRRFRFYHQSLHLHSTMLLLYLHRTLMWRLWKINLHSTMLLLYRSPQNTEDLPHSDLHSTMLLLYRAPQEKCTFPRSHLHSTMLLLYPASSDTRFMMISSFTFHYASTLSKYYSEGDTVYLNLHSTMLLLYRYLEFA